MSSAGLPPRGVGHPLIGTEGAPLPRIPKECDPSTRADRRGVLEGPQKDGYDVSQHCLTKLGAPSSRGTFPSPPTSHVDYQTFTVVVDPFPVMSVEVVFLSATFGNTRI